MQQQQIIIAVDGYASCGKSTLAKDLARNLEYIYLDSGAMYRAVTLYCLRNNIDIMQINEINTALENIQIDFRYNAEIGFSETYLNGENVERLIRSKEVSDRVSEVAVIAEIRVFCVEQQRNIGKNRGLCCDGRDIGTVVFPDAELKIFLTADMDIRAKRRFEELQRKNIEMTYDEIVANLKKRDHIDSTREHSPLRKAADAIEINNSYLSQTEQLKKALSLARKAMVPAKQLD